MEEYDQEITKAISILKEKYKRQNLCPNTLRVQVGTNSFDPYRETQLGKAAYIDFESIWLEKEENTVYELISHYAKGQNESYDKGKFARFCARLNDIFEDYSINLEITKNGLMPKQDKKISKEIYEPVFEALSDQKWKAVNDEICKAFEEYRNKKNGNCITRTSNITQGFLQILVHGKTAKGDISKLIPEAREKGMIPDNSFLNEFIKQIEKYSAKERSEKSGAHPSTKTATEKDARFLLNLTMVTIEYWLKI